MKYEIYLFETILLCCKEITPNKSKDKKDKTRSTGPKMKPKSGTGKLQLKGRIFMNNVTDIVSISRPGRCFFALSKTRLICRRLSQRPDLVEGRSRYRELYHQVSHGGNDEKMGCRLGDAA